MAMLARALTVALLSLPAEAKLGGRVDVRAIHDRVPRGGGVIGATGLAVFLLLAGFPPSLEGQAAPEMPVERGATLMAGLGNAMGWLGAQGEGYFEGDRLSAFLGAGYTPPIDPGDPSGPTFAVGLRGFTAGVKHRGFLEFSISQIFVETGFAPDQRRLYGPGIQVGYQFVSRGGFTLMASVGLGYAPGVRDAESGVGGLLGLGAGYTWRR